MKGYSSDKIRNVVLLGHGGCGKTTFLEAALLATKIINRLGKVEDGNREKIFHQYDDGTGRVQWLQVQLPGYSGIL